MPPTLTSRVDEPATALPHEAPTLKIAHATKPESMSSLGHELSLEHSNYKAASLASKRWVRGSGPVPGL